MKIQCSKLVLFGQLATLVPAQILSDAQARLAAWRAYGTYIEDMLTAGVLLTPGKDFIYVLPPNVAAVRGGTPCPQAVTNADLFSLANSMQNIAEPLMNVQGSSYVDGLLQYLESVDVHTKQATPAQLVQIDTYQTKLQAAQDKYDTETINAYTKYTKDPMAQAGRQTFGGWVATRDPLLANYQRQVQIANTALRNYEVQVYGPLYGTLGKQQTAIDVQAQDHLFPEPGYNMAVYPDLYNVQIKPFTTASVLTDGVIYQPNYSLGGGFEESCDAWFNSTPATPVTRFSWSMKNVNGQDWKSLGYSNSVTNIGGSYFSLFSASHGSNIDTTVFNSYTSTFSQYISLELTMKGPPLAFPITAGYWDVPSVRSTYPSLIPGTPDPLNQKVRLQKILCANQVGLTITINETQTWNSVYQFLQTAKKNTGGGFSIFGFKFGEGGEGASTRNVTDVRFVDNKVSGQIIIAPSPPNQIYMLGALGRAL